MSSADSPERRPTLGAIVRRVHAAMVQEYARWLAASPYRDVQPAHAAVIQPLWQEAQGARLTDLARTARMTKQSMAALVESLERGGYVERVADPDDGRAARIRLTARGRRYARDVRRFGRELEARLAAALGDRKLQEVRATLEQLLESLRKAKS
jgi:DNA-binding MarR family transcriptional regulator